MTPKQQQFVKEYLVDLNATQAAIRAGYSAKTANEQASRLLANVKIAEAVAAAQQERSERTEITQDMVLRELAKIGFSDVRSLFDDGGRLHHVTLLSDEAAAAIQSIEVDTKRSRRMGGEGERVEFEAEATLKIKLWDKQAALVNIGRHLGMFTDKVQHSGNLGLLPGRIDDLA
jgi:phage terminase small subunit